MKHSARERVENGRCSRRGTSPDQVAALVGWVCDRDLQSGLPVWHPGFHAGHLRRHGIGDPVGDLGADRAWCRPGSTPSRRRCSAEPLAAASRSTRTRAGASTRRSSARWRRSATGSAGRSCSRSSARSSATWSSRAVVAELDVDGRRRHRATWGSSHFIAIGVIIVVWVFNIFGLRPMSGSPTSLRGAADDRRWSLFIVVPYLTGDWHASQRARDLHRPVGRRQARARLPVHPRLVDVRHRGLRDLRARVQDRARHAHRAAQLGDVHAGRLHPAAARPRRRHRRPGGRDRRRASSTRRRSRRSSATAPARSSRSASSPACCCR